MNNNDLKLLRAQIAEVLRCGQQISEMLQAVNTTLIQAGEMLMQMHEVIERLGKENR